MARKASQFNLKFRDFGFEMGLCPISKFSSRIGTRLFTYVDAKTENGCLIVSLFVAGARAREKILGLARG